ncbi:hypothetical protein D3C73_1396370 [compost metagenome]
MPDQIDGILPIRLRLLQQIPFKFSQLFSNSEFVQHILHERLRFTQVLILIHIAGILYDDQQGNGSSGDLLPRLHGKLLQRRKLR